MREIVFDTETTGFELQDNGDRLVEIGCASRLDRPPSRPGVTFHAYFNPERAICPPAADSGFTGWAIAFLVGQSALSRDAAPTRSSSFSATAPLIAHNAGLRLSASSTPNWRAPGAPPLDMTRMMLTPLQMARTRHPGAKHSLDALCTRYGIDRSHRVQARRTARRRNCSSQVFMSN
jgi:DNA polymerase-3 subunit epsilon